MRKISHISELIVNIKGFPYKQQSYQKIGCLSMMNCQMINTIQSSSLNRGFQKIKTNGHTELFI